MFSGQPVISKSTKKFETSFVLNSYISAMEKLPQGSGSVQNLVQIHSNLKPPTWTDLNEQLSLLAALFAEFAASIPQFQTLPIEDQDFLLKSNTPLFLQYITARYLTAKTGLEQLTWILEGKHCLDFTGEFINLARVSIESFMRQRATFRSFTMMQIYSDYLRLFEEFFSFPHYFNGLLANALLFHATEQPQESLKEPQRVEELYNEAAMLVEKELRSAVKGQTCFKISILSFPLSQMNVILDWIQVHDDEEEAQPTERVPRPLAAGFTESEDNWMRYKFERLQSQFSSVLPSASLVQNVTSLFTNTFSGQMSQVSELLESIMEERLRRVLEDHSEFQSLVDSAKKLIWSKNIRSSLLVSIIRVNGSNTAVAQMKNILGFTGSEERAWENRIPDLQDFKTLRPVFLTFPGFYRTGTEARQLTQLTNDLAYLCSRDLTFPMLVLLSLFDTDGLPTSKQFRPVFEAQSFYSRLFHRKLREASRAFDDFTNLMTALKKVKLLANSI